MYNSSTMKNRFGLTLAEVLITLAIIGIVSALTIPTLLSNIQNKKYITASKRINSMYVNSIGMLEANEDINAARNAEDFVKNYLSRYLKISKICGYENHESCGFITKADGIHRIDGNEMTLPTEIKDLQQNMLFYKSSDGGTHYTSATIRSIDGRGYSFLTGNGYNMMLFYNPKCKNGLLFNYYVQDTVCVNILWDMNGLADPNQVGKDIGFTTVLYPKYSSVVTPMAYETDTRAKFNDTNAKCISYAGERYKAPNRNELASMFFNGNLVNIISRDFWSSESYPEGSWYLDFGTGMLLRTPLSREYDVRCIIK